MASPRRPSAASIEPVSRAEERDLARRLKQGDEDALARLLRIHWKDLVRYALPFVKSVDQAEDVVQEAFVRLWSRRETWRHAQTLRPVLYRIVRNLALNECRRRASFLKWSRRGTASDVDTSPSPLDEVAGTDLQHTIREAVDALPERRREIFILVRFHSLTYEEAAKTLGISSQTVANQVSRATKDLRAALGPLLDRQDEAPELRLSSSRVG